MLKSAADLDVNAKRNIEKWLQGGYDEETKTLIRRLMQENPQELNNAFYTSLSFGTGGLRAMVGVGCNRLNIYTIRTATQGLANYINKQPKTECGHAALIGFDSRHHSKEFAEETAKVLAANDIQVYLFREMRPTPLVSFACRLKKCSAAVMITASHNPPEYNGYKVYWSDGGQVLSPHDKNIVEEISRIENIEDVKCAGSLEHHLISMIDLEMDEEYLKQHDRLQFYPEQNKQFGSELKVVYTSLHGTGITLVPKLLQRWGFTHLSFVQQQVIPDGSFPTTKSPNPEEPGSLQMGIQQLKDSQADLLIATDPDADRAGVVIMHQGQVEILNGNQIACICLEHICEALVKSGRLPQRAAFIKTIATTELFKVIAESYNCICFDVLTGFKYIVELIHKWEESSEGFNFVFGGEESLGYLLGTQTRDKDAVLASALICEVALKAKLQGKTLLDLMHEIYQKHGVYVEKLFSIKFEESKEGHEQMKQMMITLQMSPPHQLAGIEVVQVDDFMAGTTTDLQTGHTQPFAFSGSSGIRLRLADKSLLLVRPSGTEPKVKVYVSAVRDVVAGQPVLQCKQEAEVHVSRLFEALL